MGMRRCEIILTDKQFELLSKRAKELGFSFKSHYIRYVIFMEIGFGEKLDAIYKKVVGDVSKK